MKENVMLLRCCLQKNVDHAPGLDHRQLACHAAVDGGQETFCTNEMLRLRSRRNSEQRGLASSLVALSRGALSGGTPARLS